MNAMGHLTAADLEDLREGGRLSDLRHLQECQRCSALAQQVFSPHAAADAFRAASGDDDEHPEDELPLYVDDMLSAERRAEVEKHLEQCTVCAEEVADLRQWSRRRAPSRRRWLGLAAAAAALIALFFFITRDDPTTPAPPIAVDTVAPRNEPTPPRTARKPEWEALVAATLASGRVEIAPDVLRFATPDQYRGSYEKRSDTSLQPAATAIDDPQPTLRWPATPGATYEVVVFSEGAELARSPRLTTAQWRIDRPLQRGATYRWQVRVGTSTVLPQPPAPPAIFRVLSAEQHQELADARRTHPADDLLLGLLHARAGMLDAAREHLQRHARTSPSLLAQSLVTQIPRR